MPTLRRRPVAAVAVLALAGSGLSLAATAAPRTAAPAPGAVAAGPAVGLLGHGGAKGHFDLRSAVAAVDPAARATSAAVTGFGPNATVDVDPTTGTPRWVARLDGYLTAASSSPARDVVMGYVQSHLAAFGLTQSDLATFSASRSWTDVAGLRHLAWTQTIDGAEVFGHGLRATVTAGGRLLMVGGSPMPTSLVEDAAGGRLTSATEAIRAARRDLGEKAAPGPRDSAREALFVAGDTTYRAWQVITMSAQRPALSVLDAATAGLLYRRPLSAAERNREPAARRAPGSRGLAFRYFPGAARGGKQLTVNFTSRGWLAADATTLSGPFSHTWSDVDDDDLPSGTEEVKASSGQDWYHPLRSFSPGAAFCGDPYPCSWSPTKPYSWRKNRKQSATQAFYLVNSFHDHLLADPIGFTEAAGNFQLENPTGQGVAGDPVETHTLDGADAGNGFPDAQHLNGADMATPPDGQAPRLQLYLQHQPGTGYPDGDPYAPTNTADMADRVFHEYAHGLSNRLVVDAAGHSTLGGGQAGALGEGWSDWYAMDHLVAAKFQLDRPDVADVRMFTYSGQGADIDRTEPIDCAPGSTSTACDGGFTGHRGGYTYADYGDVVGQPEVHADGEIWAQTLWDLRSSVGPEVARSLVTRSMSLTPDNPSYLDVRNAILLAETAVFDGAHRAAVWSVFAERGMGYFAGSLGGDDATPAASTKVPPKQVRTGTLSGTVTDADTGAPLAGVPVTLAFQGGPGPVNPTAVTAGDGTWSLGAVPAGTYRKLLVRAPGHDPLVRRVTVAPTGSTADLAVRRNYALASGGATVTSFTGPDHGPQCGPAGAIDGSLTSGWGSTTGDDSGTPTDVVVPKEVVVDLGTTVEVGGFAVDPSATCGDGPSASLAGYRIETSPDATTWTVAAQGTFGPEHRGRLNEVAAVSGTEGVRYVKLTMLSNQTPDFADSCPSGPYSGCSFTDVTELAVYGAPAS